MESDGIDKLETSAGKMEKQATRQATPTRTISNHKCLSLFVVVTVFHLYNLWKAATEKRNRNMYVFELPNPFDFRLFFIAQSLPPQILFC